MKFLGNLIWLIFGGIIGALLWAVAGLLFCITIIGIPLGIQAFKLSSFALWPFGREVEIGGFGAGGALGNIVWILFVGWELALGHLVAALIFAITIIGIPFARQHVKLARLSLIPFGAEIHGGG